MTGRPMCGLVLAGLLAIGCGKSAGFTADDAGTGTDVTDYGIPDTDTSVNEYGIPDTDTAVTEYGMPATK